MAILKLLPLVVLLTCAQFILVESVLSCFGLNFGIKKTKGVTEKKDCKAFGKTLDSLKKDYYNPQAVVPYFIDESIAYLEQKIDVNTILRAASSATDFNPVVDHINAKKRNIPFTEVTAPSDIIKYFLSHLPKPLFPATVVAGLTGTNTDVAIWTSAYKALPDSERRLAKRVLNFYKQVNDRYANIGVVVMPTLLQFCIDAQTNKATLAAAAKSVEVLINNINQIAP